MKHNDIKRIAEKLGALTREELPEVGGGAFGAARFARFFVELTNHRSIVLDQLPGYSLSHYYRTEQEIAERRSMLKNDKEFLRDQGLGRKEIRRALDPSKERLREMERDFRFMQKCLAFEEGLMRLVEKEAIPAWLNTKNPAFDDRAPLDLIKLRKFKPLMRMIQQLNEGMPG